MSRPAQNIEGLKIHRIVVLGRAPAPSVRHPYWFYKCHCGKVKKARADILYKGIQRSCGCERLQNRFIDISEKRFGHVTAQWPAGTRNRALFWLCLCDCGKIFVTQGKSLRLGLTKSCGCWSRELVRTHGKSNTAEYRTIASCRSRAKKLHIPFDLTMEDIVVPEFCPILGIRMMRNSGKGPTANSPTIDRLIPSLGYVRGNITIISHRANQIKNDASLCELKKIVEWMENEIQRR